MADAANPLTNDKSADLDVSILIVGYQSKGFIAECLQAISDHTKTAKYEILFIDNSDDGAADLVKARFPDVRVLPGQGNLGFGTGNNRLAAVAKAPRVLCLNPDTVMQDGALDVLVAFAKSKPQAGAWGGLTLSPEGHLDAGNRLVIPSLGKVARNAFGDPKAMQSGGLPPGAGEPGQVDVLCGGFMMVRRDVWEALGGFDESFFLYSEEVDFFARLKAGGWEAWVTPEARVTHDVGSGAPVSPTRLYYRAKGQMHYAKKHWGGGGATLAGGLFWLTYKRRWALAFLKGLAPWAKRARATRRGYGPLVWRPWRWWSGYA